MTESKEWVTIKIPQVVRDDAQSDERTYGEIMQAGLGKQPANGDVDTQAVVDQLKNELSMANEPGVEVDVEGLYNEIEKLQELVEKVPDETAEEFGRKYA